MTTVTYRLAELANITLNLGWTGENETKTFIIDCKKVFDDYPNATAAMRVYPPQGNAYPATVTKDGDNVVWVIRDSDLVYSGKGEIQLTFTEGGKVKKSVRAKTQTDESIPAGGTAPDPIQDWIDDAEAVLNALDGLEVTAETLDPDESATAEVSEDPDDGHRIIAFGIPQGVQGETGATPDISIGTVTTGAAGSDAEVEVTGTAEEPVLNFTIPKGLKGDAGNGDMLAPAYSTSATYKVGDYVTYNGGLYCCKTAITTAEAWTAAHWTSTNFGKDCSALKSALDEKTDTINGIIAVQEMVPLPFTIAGSGYIASNGTVGSSSNYKYTDYIPIGDFEKLRYKRGGSTGSSSQYAAVYDKNKNFIASSRWATNQTSAGYLETLSNITNADDRYYVRFTTYADTDTYGEFAVYGENHPLYKRITDVEAEVDTKISSETEIGKNLFNPTKGTSGYLKSNGGISSDSDYITSDFIPIANGQSVKINRIRKFLAYDSSKTVISDTYVDALTTGYVFTASQDGFIRATLYTSYASQNMIVYGNVLGMYEPYWEKTVPEEDVHLSPDMRSDAAKLSGNVLDGKKWVACGDSFTHGDFSDSQTQDYTFTDIPYYGQYKVYPYWIGRRNQGMTVINEAINGSTMTGGSSGVNPFSGTRYTEIPADADYITMMFGINDAGNSCPIGTIDDETNETFYGAWNVVLNYLITNFPYAHIGIIVGPGMQTSTGKQYANAEIAVAKKWGIPYLNIQYESGGEKIPLMLRTSNPDVSSTVKALRDSQQFVSDVQGASNHHPNAKAHEFESTFIEAWLKTL